MSEHHLPRVSGICPLSTTSTAYATTSVLHPPQIGSLALYNRSKLLIQNTLITDPQQIPNELVCTSEVSGGVGRFRFEDGTITQDRRQGQSTIVQSSQLNQNGRYVCFDGGREWPFHIYFNNGELTVPEAGEKS